MRKARCGILFFLLFYIYINLTRNREREIQCLSFSHDEILATFMVKWGKCITFLVVPSVVKEGPPRNHCLSSILPVPSESSESTMAMFVGINMQNINQGEIVFLV